MRLCPICLLFRAICYFCMGFCLLASHAVRAGDGQTENSLRTRVLPLVFSSDNTDVAYGLGGVSIGAGQPQGVLFGLGFKSKNQSNAVSIGAINYQLTGLSHWYFSGFLYQSDMPHYRYFDSEPPGFTLRGNDSTPAFKTLGLNDFLARIQARWILPIGAAKHRRFRLAERAIFPEQLQPPITLNPLESGISSLRFELEQRQRDFDESSDITISGSDVFRLQLDWDNTGSRLIPAAGGRAQLSSHWGRNHEGAGQWQLYEGALSAFIGLPDSQPWVRQQVLALNLHTTDTRNWEPENEKNRPPAYLGARLGGLMHLRGYRESRFYDRSSWVYSAEYRLIPQWQPLAGVFDQLGYRVPWWQLAIFTDRGRVAPHFSISEFHRDMKSTNGLGLRILAEGLLIRIDFAQSEEESATLVTIDQTF